MRKILLVCAALACMTVSPVPAQDAAVKKIIEMGQNDNQVMHQLDILTNRFGGRLIGSDAYENAAEWMVREFKSWGLDVQLEDVSSERVFSVSSLLQETDNDAEAKIQVNIAKRPLFPTLMLVPII